MVNRLSRCFEYDLLVYVFIRLKCCCLRLLFCDIEPYQPTFASWIINKSLPKDFVYLCNHLFGYMVI